MANAIKGEVALTAPDGPLAGDYVMVLDFNAFCDLEDELPGLMTGELEIKGFKTIRRIFHAGFARNHEGLSLRDVGDIIHSVGLDHASEKIGDAMKAAFPEAKVSGKAQAAPANGGAGAKA